MTAYVAAGLTPGRAERIADMMTSWMTGVAPLITAVVAVGGTVWTNAREAGTLRRLERISALLQSIPRTTPRGRVLSKYETGY
ncbi:hypothetical protein [Curtobacterium sp. MCBD17_040]|uniref:hypothetical protein n=1 Tax=Curtobacterium sp. MCBD17_040 TaxID=2175674 RepID=UPI000DA833DB|nr:hypothetical protein [Curtobacterium sp. MCBD17_040]WIB65694.1 hypothetical protein DEI94_16365 [Curtobacterium sp. MCBD17_040]